MSKTRNLLRAMTHRKLLLAASCVAVLLIVFGVFQLALRIAKTTGTAALPDAKQVIVHDVTEPGEKKAEAGAYTVPADQPRKIVLPTVGAEGIIQKVGINKQGAIAVPTNVHFAGWYTGSSKPGYPGLSIIDGHVSGKYGPGVFKHLTKLQKGDLFTVEYGDGSVRKFEVVEGKALPEKDAASYLLANRQNIPHQLNLVTCDGVFNKQTGQYSDRYIVVAKAIEETSNA